MNKKVEEQYQVRRRTLIITKLTIGELRVLIAKARDNARKVLYKTKMIKSSFLHVTLSLHIGDSEDHLMKFQGQPQGRLT